MSGEVLKVTKNNLLKGIPWQFGPNWPGERCGAKTRRGTLCQCPAKQTVGRCRLHGGASTGPRTKDGLARLSEAAISIFPDVSPMICANIIATQE